MLILYHLRLQIILPPAFWRRIFSRSNTSKVLIMAQVYQTGFQTRKGSLLLDSFVRCRIIRGGSLFFRFATSDIFEHSSRDTDNNYSSFLFMSSDSGTFLNITLRWPKDAPDHLVIVDCKGLHGCCGGKGTFEYPIEKGWENGNRDSVSRR